MASDSTPDQPITTDRAAALGDWQRKLMEDTVSATEDAPLSTILDTSSATPIEEDDTPPEEKLACGVCYRYFGPRQLTVASKERFNWESSVVVCPECLTELKLEMRARSSGPDLLLGVVWATIGLVLTGGLISLAIWSVRTDRNYLFWQWLGCYFAFVPGFVIGRLVRFGVGRRHSLEQQLIAIFFTIGAILLTAYVGWIADNNNFLDTLSRTTDHRVVLLPFDLFISSRLWPALTNFAALDNLLFRLGIDFGIILGLAVAFFTSEGARIYTRPFVKK